MTILELLKAARELISDPARWCQGWFALDAEGWSATPYEANAVCWCSLGALQHFDPLWVDGVAAMHILDQECGGDIIDFNDTHTHAEVLALYDAAIARLEGQVQPC